MYNPVVTSRTPQWNLQQNHLGMLADHLDMAIVPEICQWSELLTEEAVFLLFNKELSPQVLTHVSTVLETDKVWFIEASYGHPRLGQLQGLQGPCFNPWDSPVSPMFAPVAPWMCIPVITVTKWPISRTFAGARTFLLRHCARTRLEYIWIDAYPFLSRFSGTVSHPKLDPETW